MPVPTRPHTPSRSAGRRDSPAGTGDSGSCALTPHHGGPPSFRSAASSSSRIARSRTSRSASRWRRLSAARHLPEHARLPFRSTMGAPQDSQVARGEATTGARTVPGETWAPEEGSDMSVDLGLGGGMTGEKSGVAVLILLGEKIGTPRLRGGALRELHRAARVDVLARVPGPEPARQVRKRIADVGGQGIRFLGAAFDARQKWTTYARQK